jgi:hypothetical protein
MSAQPEAASAELLRHPPLLLFVASRSFSEFAYQIATVAIAAAPCRTVRSSRDWAPPTSAGAALPAIRVSLVQLARPDEMRGRVGAVNYLFVNASNQLGEFESGITAALFGTVPAALIGGLGTVAVALLWMKLFPSLRKVERLA